MSIGRSLAYVLSSANSIGAAEQAVREHAVGPTGRFLVPVGHVRSGLAAARAVAPFLPSAPMSRPRVWPDSASLTGFLSGAMSVMAVIFLEFKILLIDPIGGQRLELDAIAVW